MRLSWPSPNRKFCTLDAMGLVGLAGLLIARFIPVAKLIPFWGCAFRRITGWPCPGCGLTRVADHFAHFDFLAAFVSNPAGALAAALFAAAVVWSALHLAFKVPVPELILDEREWDTLRAIVITHQTDTKASLLMTGLAVTKSDPASPKATLP